MHRYETHKRFFVIWHIIKNESNYMILLVKYTISCILITRIIIVEWWKIEKK